MTDFKTLLLRAKENDQAAFEEILAMYRPLLLKESIINEEWIWMRSVSRIELDPFPLHPNNQNLNLIQCNEKGPQTLGTFFPVLNFCFWHP